MYKIFDSEKTKKSNFVKQYTVSFICNTSLSIIFAKYINKVVYIKCKRKTAKQTGRPYRITKDEFLSSQRKRKEKRKKA